MNANNRLLYTGSLFKKFIFLLIFVLVSLLIYSLISASRNKQPSKNNINNPKLLTPIPTSQPIPVQEIPAMPDNYTRVEEPAPFVPFAMPQDFTLVPEDEVPVDFQTQYTKYYQRTVGEGDKDWLRVSIFPNSSYKSIENFTNELLAGFTIYEKKVYKRNGMYAIDITFSNIQQKYISQYTVIYAPGFFHVIGYSVEIKENETRELAQSRIKLFINDFFKYYDFSIANSSIGFSNDPGESQVLFMNEKYFQENQQ